jgi:pimeloyl-ACP methyl ester carboxylesterase
MRKTTVAAVLVFAVLLLAACMPVADTRTSTVTLENGVVGTLQRPQGVDMAEKAPVVLMLHGFGSQKDEVGNMYARLATALAERGVGSLRIDFRGFGKSDGDTGSTTIGGQVEDAELAYNYLKGLDWVDPERIGAIGFSLGGGVAMIAAGTHPDWFDSLATWSSVGDMPKDMVGSVGEEAFATAAEKGVVGLDLGWRTIVLKQAFFDSLGQYDLPALIAQYPGGDHIYQVLTEDQTMADSVITRTADWFAETLAAD